MPKKIRRKKRLWRAIDVTGIKPTNTKLLLEGQLQHPEQKTNEQLFYIDKKRGTHPKEMVKYINRKESSKNRKLFVESALNPFPHIKPSILPKRKRESGSEKAKYIKRRKISENGQSEKNIDKSDRKSGSFDIWAPEEDPLEKIIQKNPGIEKEYLIPLGQTTIKQPKKKLPNNIPAIDIPKDGTSYNPCFESHQTLLKEAITEQMKKRKELKKVLDKLKADYTAAWNIEPEEDPIFLTLDMNEEDSLEDENSQEIITSNKIFEANIPQKTKAQRNKEYRKKKTEKELRKKLEVKERRKQLAKIQEILKEIGLEEKKSHHRTQENRRLRTRKSKIKRLGSEKYQQPEVEVLLTEELPENMRKLKSKHDPILERFNSLQKRNIIEVRSRKGFYRKYKLKYAEKRDHKEFEIEQEKIYSNKSI